MQLSGETLRLDDAVIALPMLLEITGVQAPQWADYRPGVGEQLPGLE
jgi:hypothetical protein